jgi:hypothetical protein
MAKPSKLLGWYSAAILVFFWATALATWQELYFGELLTKLLLLTALVAAILACFLGSRWWLISVILAVLTNLYVWFAPLSTGLGHHS